MEAVIVTGLSGAGRTMAADCLEDMGYYCVDNMPPALLKNFVSLAALGKASINMACFVVDGRGDTFFNDLQMALEEVSGPEFGYQILFLEASDEVLIRRYKESRRVHPMANGGTVQDGIRQEREHLQALRAVANHVLDTSKMKKADLNNAIRAVLQSSTQSMDMTVTVESFGYKYGMPEDADVVFDMRFLPNPYYVQTLKHLTGNNKRVRDYVLRAPEAENFLNLSEQMVKALFPAYLREGKYHIAIAFGCTGGQHRSVAMANAFADVLRQNGYRVIRTDRDLKESRRG